jgi:hypothetical protein
MKKRISFNINFTNRAIYTLITFSIFLLIGISVFAFGTSSPSTFGHSAGELDLSSGVNGDALFLGNVKTNGNMDVAGGIKVGTIATCDENTEGFQRYNSESKKIEFCNSTDWGEMGTGTGTGSSYTGDLVTGSNTGADCSEAGGIPTDMGGEEYVCKFVSDSCATGWTQYESWSTTAACTAGGGSGICYSSCSSGSHVFSDTAQETCTLGIRFQNNPSGPCIGYSGYTSCTATIQEVGCY